MRARFVMLNYVAALVLSPASLTRAEVSLSSPGGRIAATISVNASGLLQYNLTREGLNVIEDSRLGIIVDGADLGAGVTSIAATSPVEVNSSYPYRGVKAIAVNHYKEFTLTVDRSGGGAPQFSMIWRAYDDGIAYRYTIPGTGPHTVSGESSQWVLPPGTTMWLQMNVDYYENVFIPVQAGTLWSVFGTPVTCILPGTAGYAGGYAAIMEGALYEYSGMILEPVNGTRTLRAKHLEPSWSVQGGSCTPWRITLAVAELNSLVNSTIVTNVNPEPSAELASAAWIEPGRAVWSWWLNDVTRYEDQVPYMDAALELGFEYTLWDEKWENWSQPDLDYLLNYAQSKGLQVWLWKRCTSLDEPSERNAFFGWIDAKNAALGGKIIVGVKIDFMNAETSTVVRWYESVLQEAAAHQLMLNFHGANKPTGTSRTYPNEMTREGIRGLEYNSWGDYLPPSHNAALPFTRLLAGHADYTPVTFLPSKLGNTTFAHQLAMAFVLTSPLTHWADLPSRYLSSPALDVIKASPTVWDETLVLPGSQIGDLVMMARRSGTRWFLAILNGDSATAKTLSVPLGFLGNSSYDAVLLSDMTSTAAGMDRTTCAVTRDQTLSVWLRPGGGYIGMFTFAGPSWARGDFDHDLDVDQNDFAHLQVCMSGSYMPQTEPSCQNALMDNDNDVDQQDFEIFMGCLTGPGGTADPHCAD